eukprot:g2570.t1
MSSEIRDLVAHAAARLKALESGDQLSTDDRAALMFVEADESLEVLVRRERARCVAAKQLVDGQARHVQQLGLCQAAANAAAAESERLKGQIVGAEAEHRELRRAVAAQQQRFSLVSLAKMKQQQCLRAATQRIEGCLAAQARESDRLRKHHDELRSQKAQAQAARAEAERQLAQLRRECAVAEKELCDVEARRLAAAMRLQRSRYARDHHGGRARREGASDEAAAHEVTAADKDDEPEPHAMDVQLPCQAELDIFS